MSQEDGWKGVRAITGRSLGSTLESRIMLKLDEEQALITLGVCAGPVAYARLLDEVVRRAEFMAQNWSQQTYSHDCTPLAAAARSVTYDVNRGVLS